MIRQLDQETQNKIAAGEVVQRPSHALKELIENSLDAGAKHIRVTTDDGGVRLLQIVDDGSGVHKEDFPLLCARHATSKITSWKDLTNVATFGFRGEALCAISHVARVTVVSRIEDEACAYKARFRNGRMVKEAEATHGMRGTQISVAEMFAGMPQRRQAMGAAREEHKRCAQLVRRMAVHRPDVSFSLKKSQSPHADVVTDGADDTTSVDVIRRLYSSELADGLVPFRSSATHLGVQTIEGLAVNAENGQRRSEFIFFINDRLVECAPIRRALEALYRGHLPRGKRPFVYLKLQVDPHRVDVNVSPTKHEVRCLQQDQITAEVLKAVDAAVSVSHASRSFKSQTLAPQNAAVKNEMFHTQAQENPHKKRRKFLDMYQWTGAQSQTEPAPKTPAKKEARPDKLVRVDHKSPSNRLEMFLRHAPKEDKIFSLNSGVLAPRSEQSGNYVQGDGSQKVTHKDVQMKASGDASVLVRNKRNRRRPTDLSSVNELLDELDAQRHESLDDLFARHFFVGLVDDEHLDMAVVQCDTQLMLVRIPTVTRDFFFEQALRNFAHHPRISLNEPGSNDGDAGVSVLSLMTTALQSRRVGWTPADGPVDHLARKATQRLWQHAEMLSLYFSITLVSTAVDSNQDSPDQDSPDRGLKSHSEDSVRLVQLPELAPRYTPPLLDLPLFLLRLATNVDWSQEKQCFVDISNELANFYAFRPRYLAPWQLQDGMTVKEIVEHTIFPALRAGITPLRRHAEDGSFVVTARLEQLYKIFERC